MTFEDRVLTCIECNAEFTYEASEQELHHSLGYQHEPKRCPSCREAKKARVASSRTAWRGPRGGGPRELHTTTCAGCGGEARVPFKPRLNRPVYCNACFQSNRAAP